VLRFDFTFAVGGHNPWTYFFLPLVQIYFLLLLEMTSGFSQRYLLVQQGKPVSSRQAAIGMHTDKGTELPFSTVLGHTDTV